MKETDKFCQQCGANILPQVSKEPEFRRGYVENQKACFGPAGSGVGIWGSISGGVFLLGIAVLWYYDLWWPGILFLIALMIIIGAVVSQTRR